MNFSLRAGTTLSTAITLLLGVACAAGGSEGNVVVDDARTASGGASGSSASSQSGSTSHGAGGASNTSPVMHDCVAGEDREGCECPPDGGSRPCYVGEASHAGVGACVRGVQTCIVTGSGEFKKGAWGACTGSVAAAPSEVCNGVDDTCDGHIDEGDPSGGDACDTGKPGSCHAGVWHCQAGARVCVGTVAPGAPQCNGLDNDCDGVVDAPSQACTAADGTAGKQACAGAAWGACVPNDPWQGTPCLQCIETTCHPKNDPSLSSPECVQAVAGYLDCLKQTNTILACDQMYIPQCPAIRKLSECAAPCSNYAGGTACTW